MRPTGTMPDATTVLTALRLTIQIIAPDGGRKVSMTGIMPAVQTVLEALTGPATALITVLTAHQVTTGTTLAGVTGTLQAVLIINESCILIISV